MGIERRLLSFALGGIALCSCIAPAEFGEPSTEIEEFDADYQLRGLRHERGYDFDWVNPRMQHVVHVLIQTMGGGRNQCNGVLVGPDLVLTAAHCLKGTAYLTPNCNIDEDAEGTTLGRVIFDDQLIMDGAGARRVTPRRRIEIREVAAHLDGTEHYANSAEGVCATPAEARQIDAVILRLAESVPERGFARVRTRSPLEGQLLPVMHHPSETASKLFTAVRAQAPSMTFVNTHVADEPPVFAEIGAPEVQCGSSGSPLYDEEGYVIGVVSGADLTAGTDCRFPDAAPLFFANNSLVFSNSEYTSVVSPAPETSGFALGRFAGPREDSGLSLERVRFSAAAERPRAVAEREAGGFVTAGYATNETGQHVFALVGYDGEGSIDPNFGSGLHGPGMITHDIDSSPTEELVDIGTYSFGGESRTVAIGNIANPDSIAVVAFDAVGQLDSEFGIDLVSPGLTRVDPPAANGASAAAVRVAPDGSIFVAGHAAVDVVVGGEDRGSHETPLVARLNGDGSFDDRCGSTGVTLWRPEGTATVEQLLQDLADDEVLLNDIPRRRQQIRDTVAAATYDMVVTDMDLDPSGGILLVGYLHQQAEHRRRPWIGRLNPDCTPDQSFGPSTTGVTVLMPTFFPPNLEENPATAWFSSVVVERETGRIYVAGTVASFDDARGIFAGRMFVAAFNARGTSDITFMPTPTSVGLAVVPSDGWHEEANGIALVPDEGEPRVVLAGLSYLDSGRTSRRIRMASYLLSGPPFIPPVTISPTALPGLVDAWATDIIVSSDLRLIVSLAHNSELFVNPLP